MPPVDPIPQSFRSAPVDTLMDAAYKRINLRILRTTCLYYNPKVAPCQNCKFYSSHPTCDVWQSAFGDALRAQLMSLVNSGIRVGKRFIDLWNARKVQMESAVPKKAMIAHPAGIAETARPTAVSVKSSAAAAGVASNSKPAIIQSVSVVSIGSRK